MSVRVNPKILVWARESAGFTLDEAATKLFKDGVKATALEKLDALEKGEKEPTRTQLAKLSGVYKRPLLTFYLVEAPSVGKRGQDFRQTPESRTLRENALLDALLRDVKARQEAVRDLLNDDDDFEKLPYVGSVTLGTPINAAVRLIAEALNFDHTDVKLRRGDPDKLFKLLRQSAEETGVFVLLLSDLGSYHSTIPSSVFRGFAIADSIAPFVVLNGKEAKASRSFTLMHELAHIWLGSTGVSGHTSTDAPSSATSKIERYCNDLAGEFLLPTNYYRSEIAAFDPSDAMKAEDVIDAIAYRWSVSGPMVAYKLFRDGALSGSLYSKLNRHYSERWAAALKSQRDKLKDKEGPNPNVVKSHNLGNALLGVVSRTVRDNALTYTKAARILGAKPNGVEPLLRIFEKNRRNKTDLFYGTNGAS